MSFGYIIRLQRIVKHVLKHFRRVDMEWLSIFLASLSEILPGLQSISVRITRPTTNGLNPELQLDFPAFFCGQWSILRRGDGAVGVAVRKHTPIVPDFCASLAPENPRTILYGD